MKLQDTTKLSELTVADLRNLFLEFQSGNTQGAAKPTGRLVYGLDGIRELFHCSHKQVQFYDYFSEKSIDQFIDFGEGIIATMFRLAVITFRIAMILTALRMMENGDLLTNPICNDTDFHTALVIGDALRQHASKIFCELFGAKSRVRLSASAEQSLLDALPNKFGRKEYIAAAKELDINPRTAEGYISKFTLKGGPVERYGYGKYRKKV